MSAVRLSARGWLTVLYTALVLAAGLVVTGLTYVLMRGSLGLDKVFVYTPPDDATVPPPAPPRLPDEIVDRARNETLSEFVTQSAIAVVVVTLLAMGLGWLLAGRVLRPIRQISSTAQRLSVEDLTERVPVTAPADDLAQLAGTINGMLDRIEDGVAERDRVLDSQRMFTANAAHELRTPLTTMRTAVDVTLDGDPTRAELLAMAADIRAAIDQSQRTLDGLLALARSQAGPSDQHPVDLAEIVVAVLDRAALRDLTVRTDLHPAPLWGEPTLLDRMTSNLADNAARYNHPSGRIAVTTGVDDNGQAFLRMTNTGPLIAANQVDNLLEPFVRGNGSRARAERGAGIGLSIVRAIAAAHSGEIETHAPPTGGLDITLRFPARPEHSLGAGPPSST